MPRAAIMNYGVGNLFNIKCSLERAGFNTFICLNSLQDLKSVDAIILPGVGNFRAEQKIYGGLKVS